MHWAGSLHQTQQSHVCHSEWHFMSWLATLSATRPNNCYLLALQSGSSSNRPQVSCFSLQQQWEMLQREEEGEEEGGREWEGEEEWEEELVEELTAKEDDNFQTTSEHPELMMSSASHCHIVFLLFTVSLTVGEHIFVHSNVNISAVHVLHSLVQWKLNKSMFQQHVCVSAYISVHVNNLKFSLQFEPC